MAGEKLRKADDTPNEHEAVGLSNYNNESYATDNQYGQDLSGVTYKEGISEHFGGDGSIGENDVKRMMEAGYSSDDVYNFSKKRGLNYNQHGRKYMEDQGDYAIGKGKDQWGDVVGTGGGSDDGGGDGGGGGGTPDSDGGTPKPTPEAPPRQEIDTPGMYPVGGMTQNVNQNNDINSNVTGDNNTVTNTQDNSIRQGFGAWGTSTADRAKALRDRYVADVSRFTGA